MTNCVTTATMTGTQLRTPTDSKASTKGRFRVMADALSLPDKEKIRRLAMLLAQLQHIRFLANFLAHGSSGMTAGPALRSISFCMHAEHDGRLQLHRRPAMIQC